MECTQYHSEQMGLHPAEALGEMTFNRPLERWVKREGNRYLAISCIHHWLRVAPRGFQALPLLACFAQG